MTRGDREDPFNVSVNVREASSILSETLLETVTVSLGLVEFDVSGVPVGRLVYEIKFRESERRSERDELALIDCVCSNDELFPVRDGL